MKKKAVILICLVVLFSTFTVMVFAADPVKLIVNGKEIKPDVPPQLVNGRIMVPVRWVAESLGADVQWNGDTVNITGLSLISNGAISKQQVAAWIKNQGKYEDDSYFMEGLSYELVNMDADDDLEIMAKIDGAVHLGQFFIFDKDPAGEYRLIAEHDWKVENWDFDDPLEIGGKKIFKLVSRTGGTGLDLFKVHLWYLDQGKFTEAWQGILLERSMVSTPGTYYKKVGSYQVDQEGKQLYAWETTHQLGEDGVTPIGEMKTTTTLYRFNGICFIKCNDNAVDTEGTTGDINYDKISAYMEEECINVFSPYYELLDFKILDYQEEVVNGNVEAIFLYKLIHKNYDKDPDKVEYIKEAKERGDSNYQQLYDEYLQPKEMNFQLKAVIDENDLITLYSNISPKGTEWEEVKMSDFIINKE